MAKEAVDYWTIDDLIYGREAQQMFNELVMEETLKQKTKNYIPYYQVRYRVVEKLREYKVNGRKYFNLKRVIRSVIKQERKVGILLPEEL